ncbi:MAG TPA: phytanoyl-CoA dioxygenase family protein [Armatimonadaceae bacterium]|nr:phytanoyl-CoA dioxygenase family protein [Armatimonadaceae bacterium]
MMTMNEGGAASPPVAEGLGPDFWNGHHRTKYFGKTRYDGELANLPYQAGPVEVGDAVRSMYSDGYVIFPGVLSAGEVAELRRRMDAMGSRNDDDYVVPGWCYNKHIPSRFHENPDLLDYIDRPGIIEVAEAIHNGAHGGDCHVTGGSSWITGEGRSMELHLDYLPMSLPESVHEDPSVRIPIFTSTAHFYLNDMVAELGPTILIPGSHRAGRPPQDETTWHGIPPQAVMVKAGDVCLFRGDVWHGAWKNTGEHGRRYMLQVHYGNGYIREQYPALRYERMYDPAVLAKATPRQRRLLGG